MAQWIGGMVVVIAMIGTMLFLSILPVALLSTGMRYYREGESGPFRTALLIAGGFVLGGVAAWNILGWSWPMSFLTTMAASVDSETYGHPVEHAAENLLVAVQFFSVTGGLVAGLAVHLLPRLNQKSS